MSIPSEPKYIHRLGSATRVAQRVAEALEQACGPAEVIRPPSRFGNGYFSIGAECARALCEPPIQPIGTPKLPRLSRRYMTWSDCLGTHWRLAAEHWNLSRRLAVILRTPPLSSVLHDTDWCEDNKFRLGFSDSVAVFHLAARLGAV
jgi:hypothetical protein